MTGRLRRVLATVVCLALAGAGTAAAMDYERVETVFDGSTTVVGEPLICPKGDAEVRSEVVTLLPGEETGWHVHAEPLFGYILKGQVTVDYRDHGARTFTTGAGFLEAMATPHNGRNTGSDPCRILVVFMGAKGATHTHSVPAPDRGGAD